MVQGEEKSAAGLKHFQQAPCVPAVPEEAAAQYAGCRGSGKNPLSLLKASEKEEHNALLLVGKVPN